MENEGESTIQFTDDSKIESSTQSDDSYIEETKFSPKDTKTSTYIKPESNDWVQMKIELAETIPGNPAKMSPVVEPQSKVNSFLGNQNDVKHDVEKIEIIVSEESDLSMQVNIDEVENLNLDESDQRKETNGQKCFKEIETESKSSLLEEIYLSEEHIITEMAPVPLKDGWFQLEIEPVKPTIENKKNQKSIDPKSEGNTLKCNSPGDPTSEWELDDIEDEKERYRRRRRELVQAAKDRVRKLDLSTTSITFEDIVNGDKQVGIVEKDITQETQINSKNVPEENNSIETEKEFVATVDNDEEEYYLNTLYNNWISNSETTNIQETSNHEGESSKSNEESDLSKLVTKNAEMVNIENYNEENVEELTFEDIQKIMYTEVAKLTEHGSIQDILRENPCKNTIVSDTESQNDDDDVDLFYKKLDKSDSTKFENVTITNDDSDFNNETKISTKEQLKKEFIKYVPCEDPEKEDYKEILKWDLKVSTENIQILKPIQRQKPEKDVDEICKLLAQSSKENKPEFECIPPKDIAEENDVIMYPSVVKYKSMYTESGKEIKKEDIKPPQVYKCLTASANYPVFQMNKHGIVENEMPKDEVKVENSIIMCNKISDVRVQMAEFSKNLEEFRERSRVATEEIIKDYNDSVEKETEIIDTLILMKDKIFKKKTIEPKPPRQITTNIEDIDEKTFRRHFKDMGVDIIEDDDDDAMEQELNEEVRKSKEELYQEIEKIKERCLDNLNEVSEIDDDDEEEYAKAIVKTELINFIAQESIKNSMQAKGDCLTEDFLFQDVDIESETTDGGVNSFGNDFRYENNSKTDDEKLEEEKQLNSSITIETHCGLLENKEINE